MKVRVQKWGNSLALRIPRSFAAETRIGPDALVDLSIVDGRLVITPSESPRFALEQLLEAVTDENLHGEVETGPAVGAESW